MSAVYRTRDAAWRAGVVLCAMLALLTSASAQKPPIVIPPATQITPPQLPPVPATVPVTSIAPPPAMRSLLPTSIATLRDARSAGIVMYGQLTGVADSAPAVVSAIFAYSQAFEPTPAPLLAVADKDNRSAQTLFTATVHGAPVLGIAVVRLRDDGGDVSVFYDYPDSFVASFPRLQQALGQDGSDAALSPLHLADGSEIGMAPGWRVTGQGVHLVELAGPQGELLTLGDTIPVYAGPTALAGSVAQGPCCDPAGALQAAFPQIAANAQRRGMPAQQLTAIADSTPATAPTGGQGALILANVSVGGRAYSYLALAEAIGGFTDPWTFHLSGAMAPQPVFAAELPMLLAMWGSYSANPAGFADQLTKTARNIETLQPMLPSPFSATSTAVYRASGGWNEVLRAFQANGNHPLDDAAGQRLLDRLADDTDKPWHISPLASAN